MKTILEIITLLLVLIGLINQVLILYKSEWNIVTIGLVLIMTICVLTFLPITFFPFSLFGFVSLVMFFRKIFKKNKKKIPKKVDLNDENSLYLQSEVGTIQIANPFRGIIVEGGAGSGKSKSIFYPIIKQLMQHNYTGVLYDFKSPELSEFAYAMYQNSESRINFSFLDFKNHNRSSRINPLSPKYLTKQAIAFELSAVLMNNLLPENIKKPDYWSRSSISIIAGAIWYLRNNHPDKCSLPHLIAMILSFPSGTLIDVISQDLECIGMISSIKEAHEMKAEKQLAGVVGTIKNALAQLNFPELFYLLSSDDVDLDLNNPETPTFLCIGNDSTLSTTYAPIISLVISVCLRKMNEPNKLKSAVLLDEAPTLYIPNLEQIPATARSNKIATIIGLQDYSQMVDKYGQDKAQVFISNLGNQFYGRTVNERTAKMISALFGKEDKTYTSKSTSKGSSSRGFLEGSSTSKNTSSSQSVQERERVKVSDITNLTAGKFFAVIAEGNHTELLGVQLNQVESEYKNFDVENEVNTSHFFEMIYKDVEGFLNPKKEDIINENNDFKIELN